MRILYIEDCHCLAELFLETIEGHEVDWFDNRDDAHKKLWSEKYDLVISDFNVPNGKFKETQQMCEQFNLPLILVSAESWSENHPCPHDLFISKSEMFTKIDPAISSFEKVAA